MNVFYLVVIGMPRLLASGSPGTLSSILSAATELLTWATTSMTSIASWIVSTPVALVLFVIILVSLAMGFVYRAINKL